MNTKKKISAKKILLLVLICNTNVYKYLQYLRTAREYIPVSLTQHGSSRENRCFSWLLEGPTVGFRTPWSRVAPFPSTASPPLDSLLHSPLSPLPLLRPLIKAGLPATAAHQGAPHPHLQQHRLLDVPLSWTHMGASTPWQTTHRYHPPTPRTHKHTHKAWVSKEPAHRVR